MINQLIKLNNDYPNRYLFKNCVGLKINMS